MTDLKLSFTGSSRITQMQPNKLPDLFKGSSVTVLGRYSKSGRVTAILEGKLDGRKTQYEIEITLPEKADKHEFIAPLWAARRVGYLLDQIKINGSSQELIDETTLLAKKYGIVTPYTSYLIVEDERQLVRRQPPNPRPGQPIPMPEMPRLFTDQLEEEAIIEKSEAEDMMTNSGAWSVQNSSSNQRLKSSSNYSTVTSSRSIDKENKSLDLNIANANGRAFYNNAGKWIDPAISSNMHLNSRKIKFASDEYFELLKNNPELNAIVALGNNIQFVFNNERIEIYDPS